MPMPLQRIWRYLPAQVIALATQLFALLLWARLLPLDQIGRLTLVIAAQEIVFAVTLAGWSHYMLRFRGRHDALAFRQTEKGVLAGATLLQALALFWSLSAFVGAGDFSGLIVPAVAFTVFRSLSVYMAERARADDDGFAYTCLQALVPGFGLLGAVIAIFHVAPTAHSVLCALALAHCVGFISIAIRGGWWWAGVRLDRRILIGATSFVLPASLAALAAVGGINAPRFVVERELGIAAAGLFAIVYGLGLRISSGAVTLVSAGAYPEAVRKMESAGVAAGHRQLAINIELLALVLFPAVFGFIALAPSCVLLFLPPALHIVGEAMLPLAALFGFFRYFRSHSTDQVFLLHGHSAISMGVAVLELTLIVCLCAVGISLGGLAGAFAGTVIAAAICWLASILVAHQRFEFKFPTWPVIRCAAVASAMALCLQFVPMAETFPALALRIAMGAVLYSLCLLPAYFPRVGLSALQARLRGGPNW